MNEHVKEIGRWWWGSAGINVSAKLARSEGTGMTLAEILVEAAKCRPAARRALWFECAESRHAASVPILADQVLRLPRIATSTLFHYCPHCWTVFYENGRALNQPE